MKAMQAAERGGYRGLRGVDIINLERESLADGLARLAPGGVDVVIDALGGPITGQAAQVSGFSLFAASAQDQAEAYPAALPLIAGGAIAPAHDRSFPLEAAPEALRHLIEDRPFGT